MHLLNTMIKNAFRAAGLNLSRIGQRAPSPLLHHQIQLLLDVGANIGQYAMATRAEGYQGRIVSFEPLPDAYERLLQRSKSDPLWTVHKRCAVGSRLGETEINISQNSVSSSLLPMLQAHASAAPASVYIGKAKTEVITLDSVIDVYRRHGENTLLKIDTQGFEREVLDGLSEHLRSIFAVQLELSVVPLYAGQDLYQHFFTFFQEHGFVLWSMVPGFSDPQTGQLLQFDAVFVRSGSAN